MKASTDRFLQTDPISYAGGMNLFAYVRNDPVNFIDPWGLTGECRPEDGPDCITVTGVRPGRLPPSATRFLSDWQSRNDGLSMLLQYENERAAAIAAQELLGAGDDAQLIPVQAAPDLDPQHPFFCESSRYRLDEIEQILLGLGDQIDIIEGSSNAAMTIAGGDIGALVGRDRSTANNPWIRGFRNSVRAVRNFFGLNVRTRGRATRAGSVGIGIGVYSRFSGEALNVFRGAQESLRNEARYLEGARSGRGCGP